MTKLQIKNGGRCIRYVPLFHCDTRMRSQTPFTEPSAVAVPSTRTLPNGTLPSRRLPFNPKDFLVCQVAGQKTRLFLDEVGTPYYYTVRTCWTSTGRSRTASHSYSLCPKWCGRNPHSLYRYRFICYTGRAVQRLLWDIPSADSFSCHACF